MMTVHSKRCGTCGETKLASEFYLNRTAAGGLQGRCKSCEKERRDKTDWRAVDASRNRLRLKCAKFVVKLRARGDLNDITTDYLYEIAKHVTHCECCGVEFKSFDMLPEGAKVKPYKNSMSFDAVDNDRGHWQGNIGIICHECNRLKGSRNLDYWRGQQEAGFRPADFIVEYMEKYIDDDTDI